MHPYYCHAAVMQPRTALSSRTLRVRLSSRLARNRHAPYGRWDLPPPAASSNHRLEDPLDTCPGLTLLGSRSLGLRLAHQDQTSLYASYAVGLAHGRPPIGIITRHGHLARPLLETTLVSRCLTSQGPHLRIPASPACHGTRLSSNRPTSLIVPTRRPCVRG